MAPAILLLTLLVGNSNAFTGTDSCEEADYSSSLSTKVTVRIGVGVLSKSDHFAFRQRARDSWMQFKDVARSSHLNNPETAPRVIVRFFVANNSTVHHLLRAEAARERDIVFVPVFENRKHLGWQTLELMRYFSGVDFYSAAEGSAVAIKVQYIVKSDDDVFVRADKLLQFFDTAAQNQWANYGGTRQAQLVYGGTITRKLVPLRKGPYRITEQEYADSTFPDAALGPTYFVSTPLAAAIATEHAQLLRHSSPGADDSTWTLGAPQTNWEETERTGWGPAGSGALAAGGGLRVISLEDVSTGLWVRHLRMQKQLHVLEVHAPGTFHRTRICSENAANMLIEWGKPLIMDTNAIFSTLLRNHRTRKEWDFQQLPPSGPPMGRSKPPPSPPLPPRFCLPGSAEYDFVLLSCLRGTARAARLPDEEERCRLEMFSFKRYWHDAVQRQAALAMILWRLEENVIPLLYVKYKDTLIPHHFALTMRLRKRYSLEVSGSLEKAIVAATGLDYRNHNQTTRVRMLREGPRRRDKVPMKLIIDAARLRALTLENPHVQLGST